MTIQKKTKKGNVMEVSVLEVLSLIIATDINKQLEWCLIVTIGIITPVLVLRLGLPKLFHFIKMTTDDEYRYYYKRSRED